MPTTITFDSLNMNDGTTYITHTIDHMRGFERNLSVFNLARANGAVITDSNYTTKLIPHTGRIKGTSLADLESKVDAFHQTMTGFKKNLDIGYAGGTRRYIATAAKAEAIPDGANTWAEFEVEYMVTEFGRDTAATTLINAVGDSTASYAPSLLIGGSAPHQPLHITITVTAATDLSNRTISVATAGGLVLSVRRNWTAGEVLTIDEANYSVKVGSTPVEWSGFFPTLAPAASGQVLTFTNDFTTRTLTYTISHIRRYK